MEHKLALNLWWSSRPSLLSTEIRGAHHYTQLALWFWERVVSKVIQRAVYWISFYLKCSGPKQVCDLRRLLPQVSPQGLFSPSCWLHEKLLKTFFVWVCSYSCLPHEQILVPSDPGAGWLTQGNTGGHSSSQSTLLIPSPCPVRGSQCLLSSRTVTCKHSFFKILRCLNSWKGEKKKPKNLKDSTIFKQREKEKK